MAQSAKHLFGRAHDFWLARGAVLVIVGLQIAIVNDLAIGPRWLAPAIELALLVPLTIATAWTQRRARKASTKEQVSLVWRGRLRTRRLAITLTAVVTAMNFGALARLIEAILAGHAASGRTLLLDAVNIWATNVIIFALWFWALDRGGPAGQILGTGRGKDFIFTQQQPGRPLSELVAGIYRLPVPRLHERNRILTCRYVPPQRPGQAADDGGVRYLAGHHRAGCIARRRHSQLAICPSSGERLFMRPIARAARKINGTIIWNSAFG